MREADKMVKEFPAYLKFTLSSIIITTTDIIYLSVHELRSQDTDEKEDP